MASETSELPVKQVVIKDTDVCAELRQLRDLLNAQVFFGTGRMSYASTLKMLLRHFAEHPPDDLWRTETALEVVPVLGRPRKRPWADSRPRTC